MEIRLYATLRELAGTKSIVLEGKQFKTIGDVLLALVEAHPALKPLVWHADGTLVGHLAVMLNGRDIRNLDGVDTPLGDADLIHIFPPVGGG